MSYIQQLHHIVIRTHNSGWTINEENENEFYAYVIGICENYKVKLLRIGGMPDHIHLLVSLHSTLSLAKFVQELKIATSKWLKSNKAFPDFDGWSKEYAVFSYAYRDKDLIVNYIKNQKIHHESESLTEEYKTLLIENGVEYDDKYFLLD